ncbi:hypothetical protein MMC26_006485 [Xylographa opegraphella]|nr:hypothetical protein [Xylographa opegraphella]
MLFFFLFALLFSFLSSASTLPLRPTPSLVTPTTSSTQAVPSAYNWGNSSTVSAPSLSNHFPGDLTARDSDRINHGLCSIHVRQVFGDLLAQTKGSTVAGIMTASLHDGWHRPIGDLTPAPFDYFADLKDPKRDVEMTSKLPYVLTMEMSCEDCKGIDKSHGEHMRIKFLYGAEWWMSNADGYCSEGWADEHTHGRRSSLPWGRSIFQRSTPIAWTRDMDCSFRC